MELNEIERLYGEKPITEEGFTEYYSPEGWKSPENDKFNNNVGIVKAEASDHSPAFKFNFVGKTPEWIFKNIIDNTKKINKEVAVGTSQMNHKESHVEWLDKETGFSYFDYNVHTNTFIVALSVWYAFYIETGLMYRDMQKFFGDQLKYNFDLEPDNITMISHIMNEKVMSFNAELDKNRVSKKPLNEMEKLKQELNSVTEKYNQLANKYGR